VTHFGKAWRATAGLCHAFLVSIEMTFGMLVHL